MTQSDEDKRLAATIEAEITAHEKHDKIVAANLEAKLAALEESDNPGAKFQLALLLRTYSSTKVQDNRVEKCRQYIQKVKKRKTLLGRWTTTKPKIPHCVKAYKANFKRKYDKWSWQQIKGIFAQAKEKIRAYHETKKKALLDTRARQQKVVLDARAAYVHSEIAEINRDIYQDYFSVKVIPIDALKRILGRNAKLKKYIQENDILDITRKDFQSLQERLERLENAQVQMIPQFTVRPSSKAKQYEHGQVLILFGRKPKSYREKLREWFFGSVPKPNYVIPRSGPGLEPSRKERPSITPRSGTEPPREELPSIESIVAKLNSGEMTLNDVCEMIGSWERLKDNRLSYFSKITQALAEMQAELTKKNAPPPIPGMPVSQSLSETGNRPIPRPRPPNPAGSNPVPPRPAPPRPVGPPPEPSATGNRPVPRPVPRPIGRTLTKPPIKEKPKATIDGKIHEITVGDKIGGTNLYTLYQGFIQDTKQFVAVRTLVSDLDTDVIRNQFFEAAKNTQKLDHPSIAKCYGYGKAAMDVNLPERPYIAMEHDVEKGNKVFPNRQIIPTKVIIITKLLASALDHAHKKGVYHGCINSYNVYNSEGQIKLTNFGLDKILLNSNKKQKFWVERDGYMAEEDGEKGDIYSLGLFVYDMLTGFSRKRHHEHMAYRLWPSKEDVDKLRPLIKSDEHMVLIDTLEDMLSEPEKRPSAAEIYQRLKRITLK